MELRGFCVATVGGPGRQTIFFPPTGLTEFSKLLRGRPEQLVHELYEAARYLDEIRAWTKRIKKEASEWQLWVGIEHVVTAAY
jgi:hypothetical protein